MNWQRCMKNSMMFWLVLGICFLGSFSAQAKDKLSGKVLDTMNSGGYTYVQIGDTAKKQWVAVPQMLIHKGDEVEFKPGVEMGMYTSPTLGRTFVNIVFSGGVTHLKRLVGEGKGVVLAAGHKPMEIAKATGPNAYTIVEIYENKLGLNGKNVVVRGKILKSSKYAGFIWLRLVDGTGSSERGNRQLVVTTKQTGLKKGDIVQVSGVMHADKSFGSLVYEVIVERAEVVKK